MRPMLEIVVNGFVRLDPIIRSYSITKEKLGWKNDDIKKKINVCSRNSAC